MSKSSDQATRLWIYLREFPALGDRIHSGTCKAVHGLAAGLVENGADVTVLCENDLEHACTTPHGYKIRSFRNPPGRFSVLHLSNTLKKFIENEPPALTILNGIFHPSVALLSRFLGKRQIPYIVAPHDPYHPSIFSQKAFLKAVFWHFLERRMLRQAQCVQVLDLRHADFLEARGVYTPVIEVQNGYAPEDVLPENYLKWDTGRPAEALFLGRLDMHNKGLDVLVESLHGLDRPGQLKLTLQGPNWGDKQALLDRITQYELTGTVRVEDPDYASRSTELIARHDIFCLPSRFEGFGLSALEAMLAGRVLLVSDIAGIAPHVRESGCGVVVNAEVDSIRRGFRELLDRRAEWKQMGLQGRQYALENLRWERIARKALIQYRAADTTLDTPSLTARAMDRRMAHV